MDGCFIGDMMSFKDGVVGKQIGSCSRSFHDAEFYIRLAMKGFFCSSYFFFFFPFYLDFFLFVRTVRPVLYFVISFARGGKGGKVSFGR